MKRMYLRKNSLGIIAFTLVFIATAFILLPRVFPKTISQQELEQNQESFENYVADTAISIRDKLVTRVKEFVSNRSDGQSEAKQPETQGIPGRLLDRINPKETQEASQKDASENAVTFTDPVTPANPPLTRLPFDWRENLPRTGFLLGVVALFAASLSFIRQEDKRLSRTVLILSLVVVGTQVLALFLDTLIRIVSIIAVCLVIAAALHLLADGGLEI